MDDLIARAQNAVMIVAHPDDETLWGAGIILKYPEKDWTIICCTVPFRDPERTDKFRDACAVLGATARVIRHPERNGLIPIPDLGGFDLIVTHNEAGEYGHVQHKELHHAIKARWPDKAIYFGYGGKFPKITISVDKERKLAALKCYDHRSPTDHGLMKWQALLEVFEPRYNLWREIYEW